MQIDFVSFDDHYNDEFNNLPNPKLYAKKMAISAFDDYDLVVYNFGNNWENHGQIINLSSRHPGIIILHDASMHHVVAYYTMEKFKDKSLYANFMIGEYGQDGLSALIESQIQTTSPKFGPWDNDIGPDFGFLDFRFFQLD
jgi:hypothetical protein